MISTKQQIIQQRNSDKNSRVILGVVLGEIERLEKSPKRKINEATDEECINIIKKLIESNIQCNQTDENVILEQFIPKQLSETEVVNIINNNNFSSIKECMNYFKNNYNGRYNGKIVSGLFNLL